MLNVIAEEQVLRNQREKPGLSSREGYENRAST